MRYHLFSRLRQQLKASIITFMREIDLSIITTLEPKRRGAECHPPPPPNDLGQFRKGTLHGDPGLFFFSYLLIRFKHLDVRIVSPCHMTML